MALCGREVCYHRTEGLAMAQLSTVVASGHSEHEVVAALVEATELLLQAMQGTVTRAAVWRWVAWL